MLKVGSTPELGEVVKMGNGEWEISRKWGSRNISVNLGNFEMGPKEVYFKL